MRRKLLSIMLIIFVVPSILCSCDFKRDEIETELNNEPLNDTEELTETAVGEYGRREPEMAIEDEETALAVGTIILKNYFNYFYESIFEVEDKDEYWIVYSYVPDPTDENGEILGHSVGGGFSVTFRKSDCKIIDIGIED